MAQSSKEPIASVLLDLSEVRWFPHIEHDRLVLTVSRPDGEVVRKAFKSGINPFFRLVADNGERLPEGSYTYEIVLVPNLSADVKEILANARRKGNTAEVIKDLRQRGQMPKEVIIQSGAFLVENGAVFADNGEESNEQDSRSRVQGAKKKQGPIFTPQDVVNPDDVIVQGSLCVGLDCVNNESFGFDTIRLKENNTRIKFEDTSTSAGFPSNDWQLTANDSASGGANKFSIEDITGARVPFTITAGAATNSIFVDSTGRLGLRTSTPVLDIHSATGNTPALRFEQNSSGGFTAQTWDVAGNEANFFVRDVTSGSLLPFRIRPGAPTSSLDIAASGNVGIGTGSPSEELHVSRAADENVVALVQNTNNTANAATILRAQSNTAVGNFITHADAQAISRFGQSLGGWTEILQTAGGGLAIGTISTSPLVIGTNSTSRMFINGSTGNIGLGGQNAPTSPIHHANGATLSAGGMWTNASSRSFKMNIRSLSSQEAVLTLQQMNPVTFEYKADPREKHVGFIAEDVPDLVATADRKGLSTMDIVAVLTKVVQEQQQTIAELKQRVDSLEKPKVKKARHQKKM